MEEKKKDDDEISIDLGKIKSFFRSKKEEHKGHAVEHKGDEKASHNAEAPKSMNDDEINIDFSKIKSIFRKKPTAKYEAEKKAEKDEDISIDFGSIKDFFVKRRVLLLLLIPILLSIFLRAQPGFLSVTDEWAANSVINNYKNQIANQISQQYPNLPDQNENALIENELAKLLREQKGPIDQQIRSTSDYFKSRLQDDSGQTYLSTIDPYFWMRYSQNVLKNGHPGDEIRDGKPWDNHMLAPEGRAVAADMLHAYFVAYLYKFFSFFNNNLSLAAVSFYVPLIIAALSVIPAFFITRKIAGDFGGFIASLVVAIHPSFLVRTMGGISDTDGYNIVFPLFIAWLFVEALESESLWKNLALSAIGGVLVGLFSWAWGGWWYIFDFILASAFLYIGYYSYIHRKELFASFYGFAKQKAIRNSIIFIAIFFIVSGLSIGLIVGPTKFLSFYRNPGGFAKLKEVGITTIWPNVFTTVAEQNPASLNHVITQIGLGKEFFFLIALMGITLTVTRKKGEKWWFLAGTLAWYVAIFLTNVENLNTFLILISIPIVIRILIALWESDSEIDIKYAILLIFWFIATIFASTKGIRFTLLLVPAFAIGFGIALGGAYRHLAVWISRGLNVNKAVSKTAVIVSILLLLVSPYTSAQNTARSMITDFDDAWKDSLEKIKAESKPDAIVNSWWDFGHWFKFWADRKVTFDGTSQNTPQAHWVGKVLITEDEELAIGILRMLDCSGYIGGSYAFDRLNNLTKDRVNAIDILYQIMPKNREDARKVLKKYFSDDKGIESVLEMSHCSAPENYFITSEDMVGKSGVWAHFGSWNFHRALIYNTLKSAGYQDNLEKSVSFLNGRFNLSGDAAEKMFYEVQSIKGSDQANSWIAPWPGYAGIVGCSKDQEIVTCSNGFKIDLKSNEVFASSGEQDIVHPKKTSIPTNTGIIIKEYNESVVNLQNGRNLGLALIKDGDSYQMMQMDSDLAASMFTRLFYQEGVGLRYFKKFSDQTSLFGSRVIVWKVDWEGKEKKVIETQEAKSKSGEALQSEEK